MTRGQTTFLAIVAGLALSARAAAPGAEKLLPDDTLVLVTAPDFVKLREIYKKSPPARLWDDPALKPFREKFVSRFQEEFVKPLERELDVKLDNYTSLPRGQVTFAVTQNGWEGDKDQPLGFLLLLDTGDKSEQLKKNLAELRKRWVDDGKPIRSEKIRGCEFSVLSMSSNDVPKTLRKFFPPASEVQELGADNDAKKAGVKNELVLGQAESLLILGNSLKVVEKVVIRLTGGAMPALGELAAYQANHLALFRDPPLYGWVNAKTILEVWGRKPAKKENPEAPNPFDPKPDQIIAASGLAGLKTIAFSFQDSNEGELLQVFLGVPEASRQGLFKILGGEAKESSPPPFVPGDAVKFQRWRLDGQKAWATLEKMLADLSPQAIGTANFLLDSANTYAKDKNPGFDIRKNLIGNLGDDLVSYEKAARSATRAESPSAPSLFLLGSPRAEELAAALKSVLVFLSQQAGAAPEEREFLGRKIYSVPLNALPLRVSSAPPAGPRTLYYAASGGYVALAMEVSVLEEYLRNADSQGKALREIPGLTEAAQKVAGPGASLFGYENQAESMRAAFEAAKKEPGPATNAAAGTPASLLPSALGLPSAPAGFRDWLDFSLLPSFEKVAKYFSFTVYGGNATVEGLTFKWFAPVPPGLKGEGR
jgi:hypothetical protein